MKEFTTTITKRGQVTLPAEVRRKLKLSSSDKVIFRMREGETAEVAPAGFTLEGAFGSVKPKNKPEDFKKISREAREAHVEAAMAQKKA